MHTLNLITLLLIIIGGINWLLVGAFDFDLVAAIFGEGTGLSRIVYVLVGLSALWQIIPWVRMLSGDSVGVRRDGTRDSNLR